MKYIEVNLTCVPNNESIHQILSSQLGEIGYESFVEEPNGTLAYIQVGDYDQSKLEDSIADFPLDVNITFSHKELEDKNWNEEWEKNYFSPISIGNECVIKSSFHKDVPDAKYTIIINPKMAFGTGHHQTTILMMKEILKNDFEGQKVLDMGCGTAILAILVSMRGAKDITAIDIDTWCYDNAIENLQLNSIANVNVKVGDAKLLESEIGIYDTIIANINRNILLQDMKVYSKALKNEGILYMSGFYTDDITILNKEAIKHNLSLEYNTEKDNWAGVKFVKKSI